MKTTLKIISVSALLLVFTVSCKVEETQYEKQVKTDQSKIDAYLLQNNISATKGDYGYYYEVLTENASGEAVKGNDILYFYYTMKLLDGTLVEQYTDTAKKPLVFKQYSSALMPGGIDAGISEMRIGEKFRFYIPSYIAYYDFSSTNLFPIFANFIVDIEIVGKTTETAIYDDQIDSIEAFVATQAYDSVQKFADGLHYVETTTGTGNKPNQNSYVTFHFTRKYLDGSVIFTTKTGNPISKYLGQNELVEGLEEGIKLMKKGGKATLIMPSSLAFGKSIQVLPTAVREDLFDATLITTEVEPYRAIVYEVELIAVY